MRRLFPFVTALALASVGAACAHSGQLPPPAVERTVLKVENRGFPDMNVFVVPEASGRVRLGTVTGNSTVYFTLPEHVVRGMRQLSFQALPIATTRGPVTESIAVTPGDTLVLIIPP
jgi:hypothetical protein